MIVSTTEIGNKLYALLAKTKDTEKGYTIAASKVHNSNLQHFFKQKARERHEFGYELQGELLFLGHVFKNNNINYQWIDMTTIFESNDEEEIFEQAIFVEKTILQEYNSILNEMKVPQTTLLLLQYQKDKIDSGFSPIKSIEKWQSIY